MDFKNIQELIKTVNKSQIAELTIEEKDFKITIVQKIDSLATTAPPAAAHPAAMAATPAPLLQAPALPPVASTPAPIPVAESAKGEKEFIIKSPMIGTFYRSPSPDKPSFVNVGDEISVGKPICIIEAMKLFNEIESEVKGKVLKILVADASPVEYDQPLFLVELN